MSILPAAELSKVAAVTSEFDHTFLAATSAQLLFKTSLRAILSLRLPKDYDPNASSGALVPSPANALGLFPASIPKCPFWERGGPFARRRRVF